jgi:hypothetical protein
MDGWADGRMAGWLAGWLAGWMDGPMNGWVHAGCGGRGGTVYLVGLAVREAIVRREDTHARATPGQG